VCDAKGYSTYEHTNANLWPNTFWLYVCMEVRENFPNLILAGDLYNTTYPWHKDKIMIESGLIPRSHNYPKITARLFGKKVNSTGNIVDVKTDHANVVKHFYKGYYGKLPKNSIMWQNLTNYSAPYPALLYGKGCWPMIDLAYFLNDTPMTFLNEISGAGHRVKGLRYFTIKPENWLVLKAEKDSYFKKIANPKSKLGRVESELNFENQVDEKFRSQNIGRTLSSEKIYRQTPGLKNYNERSIDNMNYQEELDIFYDPDVERLTFNYNNLWEAHKSASEVANYDILKHQAETIKKTFDEKCGFDLSKIKHHYEHRAKLRAKHDVFKKGKLYATTAGHQEGVHSSVLSFARVHFPQEELLNDQDEGSTPKQALSNTKCEIALVTINMSINRVYIDLDVKSIQFAILGLLGSNPDKTLKENKFVVYVEDLIGKKNYGIFTMAEFLNIKHEIILEGMGTSILLAKVERSSE
jgi:hypothetical protein